jgi:iron(III) transport system substrate-binding protein
LTIGRHPLRRVKAGVRMAALLTALLSLTACDGLPEADGAAFWTVRRAESEGLVTVYANNDLAGPAIEGFQRRHPRIKVRVQDLGSSHIRDSVVAEARSGRPQADIAWSTSMDIQVKLVNDGYAQPCRCPYADQLPRWAVWRKQGFGLTFEPVGFAYNRRLLAPQDVPKSHAELLAALRSDPRRWRRQIALYDPERSGLGFMYLSADAQTYPDAWDLMGAIARSGPSLDVPGGDVMRRLSSGDRMLAYNMTRTYAHWWSAHRDPDIGFVTPADYHFTISSVAFVTRAAPHPTAARLFLGYLMSPEGQGLLRQGGLTPIRDWSTDSAAASANPIRVGPALLANLDQARRGAMLSTWGRLPRHP